MVGSGILLSRITGLARERTLGHFLGTSFAADAFTAAFRIPNLLQHLLGEGVLSASFIPVYSRLLSEGRQGEARRVAGAVAGLLTAAAGLLTLIGIVLAEPLTAVIAAGLQSRPRTFELTVALVRILFPGIGFLVLSAWCLGVLNSHRRFFLSYVAPVAFNLAQIAFLVGAGFVGVSSGSDSSSAALVSLARWLAIGTVVGGALQFLIQVPTILRIDRRIRPSLRTDLPGVRTTIRSFGPVVTARGVVQLSSYAEVFLASFLAAGALATLRYAQILYMLPISLFGMAVAAAELPELSRTRRGEGGATGARLQEGLARIAAFVVPTAVGFVVIGDLVTAALFQTGRFGQTEALAVWIVLIGYASGLLATTSSRLLQSALYGIGDTRTPARLAVMRVVVAAGLGVILMVQMDRLVVSTSGIQLMGDLPAFAPLPADQRPGLGGGELMRLGAAGLSLASGLVAWLEYALLRRAVQRNISRTTLAGGQLRPVLIAASAALLAAAIVRPFALAMHPLAGGAIAVGATAVAYVATASMGGVTEIRKLLSDARRHLPWPR